MEELRYPKPCLHAPGNIAIFGPSKSGKTYFLAKLIRFRNEIFRFVENPGEQFKKIYYFFGAEQDLFADLKEEYGELISFRKGFPTDTLANVIQKEDRPALVIFDDLETEIYQHEEAKNILKRDSHHLRLTVIMVFQGLYGDGSRSVRLREQFDVQVFFAFRAEEPSLASRFAKFVRGTEAQRELFKTFKKWVNERGGYMLADFHPDRSKAQQLFRFRTKIFPNDPYTLAFISNDELSAFQHHHSNSLTGS